MSKVKSNVNLKPKREVRKVHYKTKKKKTLMKYFIMYYLCFRLV